MVPATDKHFTARIVERKDISEDLWLMRVDPGGSFQFNAGQYATLGVDHTDQRIERAYSIVSSPHQEQLEFFIELVPQGERGPDLYKLQKDETGRVDDLARKCIDPRGLRPETTTGYPCGHPGLCENGQGILQRAGWQKGSLFEQVYFIPGKEAAAESRGQDCKPEILVQFQGTEAGS
jgi:hypothetical protein